ncbi:MAG: V-type ATP synthase subunit E [Candidatus Helarchaeota archaeon]
MEPSKISLSERIDILMREVIEDAEMKAEMKIRQAEEKSRKMIRDVTAKLEEEVDQMFKDIEKKIKREREKKLIEVQFQVKNEIMAAKEKKIMAVLETIKEKLDEFAKSQQYKSFLKEAFQNMLKYLPPGHYILYLNKQDIGKLSIKELMTLNKNSELKFTISEDEYIESHGLIMKSEDGKIILEDTLEDRFIKKKDLLRSKIAKILFND